jgi:hypothetical protein
MAARRLLAFLVALMVISAVAAALAPPQRSSEESSTTETTTSEAEPADTPAGGEAGVIAATIDAGAAAENDPVEAKAGDQLALSVHSDATREIEIAGLGLYETAARGAPALFDVVLRDEGKFGVYANDELVATIFVGVKPAKPPRSRQEPPKGAAPEGNRGQTGQGPRESGSSVAA